MTDLGTLGGRSSAATAINERGDVVGNSETGHGTTAGVLWRDGRIVALAAPSSPWPGRLCSASGIDDRGRIVGRCEPLLAAYGVHAFLWSGLRPPA